MKKTIFAAAWFVLVLSFATASAGDVKGLGTAACSEISDAWNGSDLDARSLYTVAIGQWAFGYLSGRNAELPQSQRKELASLDNDETAFFVLEQCKANPSYFVYQIVDVIFDAAPNASVGA
ncbi:MAG: hypothetical protein JKX88_09035 [Marinicaulis sp.]|nr:hypothetical protein [Marinicaulis sp.]